VGGKRIEKTPSPGRKPKCSRIGKRVGVGVERRGQGEARVGGVSKGR